MKVELLRYTDDPEMLASIASHVCVSDGDSNMVKSDGFKYAVQSGHESVLEHVSFTFMLEGISRACSHQLVRHRIASYSQQSQRYVNMDGFEYVIPPTVDKTSNDVYNEYISLMIAIDNTYRSFIERGIPEEDARYILPNACMTNIVVTMNARELRHFFALRCCSRSQWEIHEMADRMLALCKEVAPIMFENAGPSCVMTGRCPEGKKSCGMWKL